MKKTISMFTLASAILFAGVNAKAATMGVGYAVKGPIVKTNPSNGGKYGLTITAITTGNSVAIPEYNGAGFGYVDLPYLVDVVNTGESITTTVQMQSLTFTSAPAVFLAYMQNGKVISQAEVVFPFDLIPDEEALAYFPSTAPATGATDIVADVYSGTTLVATQVYHIYVN